MMTFNGFRKIIKQSNELEERLKLLREQFPNFAHVVDHVIGQLRVWPLKQENKQRLKPLNLNGPKGTGKSAFAKALAEALNTRYDYVNISSSLHGEQVIDELTVRICLQDLGCKTKAHFGFVEV